MLAIQFECAALLQAKKNYVSDNDLSWLLRGNTDLSSEKKLMDLCGLIEAEDNERRVS